MSFQFSICHMGWTDEDFRLMWERLAKSNPPNEHDFNENRKIAEKLEKAAEVGGGK